MKRDYPRLGMLISKKNCRLAVDRNRIKRMIREHFRLAQHTLVGMDVVVMLRSSTEKITDQEHEPCLQKLFLQLKTLCAGLSSS